MSKQEQVQFVYAALSKNTKQRLVSSSGGIFFEIATRFLKNKGIVYGVAMNETCTSAEFCRVSNNDDLRRLFGSKYIQAYLGDTFQRVQKDLEDGLSVCFTGTGCQINGLKCFLCHEYDNLTCIDVVCHGVPSPALWKRYVEKQETKYGTISSVNFRCKDKGWENFGIKENSAYISKDDDSYMQMFLKSYSLRPSCYACHAKDMKLSDMTIADFWGIENVAPELDDEKGVSLVITRTKKGKELFDDLKRDLQWKEVSYEDGVRYNSFEYKSVIRPVQRDTFYVDMLNMSFDNLAKKYVKPTLVSKIKRIIKNTLIRGQR